MTNGLRCHRLCRLIIFTSCIVFMYLMYKFADEFTQIISFPRETKEPHPTVLEIYRAQVQMRVNLLRNVPNRPADYDFLDFYSALVPEVFCRDLVRMGQVGDGGKWICNPHYMRKMESCTVYSLGMRDDVSFDENLQNYTDNKCTLRCFDQGEQTPETLERIRDSNGIFMRALISSKFGDKRIDILKMDIEGTEFEIANEFLAVPVCQLLIEVHPQNATNPLQTLNFLRKISNHGFYLFSYEVNGHNYKVCEYSLIHENCFADYGVKTIYGSQRHKSLPHISQKERPNAATIDLTLTISCPIYIARRRRRRASPVVGRAAPDLLPWNVRELRTYTPEQQLLEGRRPEIVSCCSTPEQPNLTADGGARSDDEPNLPLCTLTAS
ncbi:methyltransferase domain-containing protein [Ditylenchus destructor]|uniref:Methyltransferase domain-containing protein n=1 Tax=Ditylenchus destructor TaxID=166010 RepID=A0AAD4MMD5_9BILA|nr:methyltransferase domain-containing protein [Ditylenchus destructor]